MIEREINGHNVVIDWTGCGFSLCNGDWKVMIDGIDVSHIIPEEDRDCPMYTYGEYAEWCFDKDGYEDWSYYKDGLHFEEWVEQNPWAKNFADDIPAEELFEMFQAEDWRYNSCGGCIQERIYE